MTTLGSDPMKYRSGIKEFGDKKVVRLLDYVQGLDGLPKSDVLKFLLEDNCSLVVRPSGVCTLGSDTIKKK